MTGEGTRLGRALLGALALAFFAGALTITGIFLTGDLQGGYLVRATFANGAGQQLPEGGDVKTRGVLVGRVAEVDLDDDGNAILELRLDEHRDFPADSSAEVRSKTIFGEKWVELIPGSSTETLRAAGWIADDRTREPLELERALQLGHDLISELPLEDLSALTYTLAEGFTGHEDDARRAMDRGLVALRAVNSRSGELDEAFSQLSQFSAWLDDNDEDLLTFMGALDSANRALVGAAPEFRASLDSVPLFLEDFADFQERIEPELARLIEDGATVAELVAARSDNLKDIVVQLEAFTTIWNSGLSQPCAGAYESGLTCWQLYQAPGMNSRGTYGSTSSPAFTAQDLAAALARRADGRRPPQRLVDVLEAPVRELSAVGGLDG